MTTTLPHDHAESSRPSDEPPRTGPSPGALPATHAAPPRDPGDEAGPDDDPALHEAAARLHAWHALREEAVAGAGAAPAEDELTARLRSRQSARHVAAAYAAAHGHPLGGHDDGAGPRRWTLGLRAAVVASVVVLLVAVVVAVVASARPDDVITLAEDAAPTAVATSAPPVEEAAAEGDPGERSAPDGDAGATPPPGTVVVHVVGEVREPGLVTVPAGARVADAVAAAGGTTRRADAAALNLARAVVDGEQIRVPRPGEEPVEAVEPEGALPGAGTGPNADGGVVDLNTAGATELEQLPGIGPALAGRIVAWRDEHGPFTSVDELDEVSGIGPAVLGQVRDLVRL